MSVRSMDPATMQVFPLDNFPARIAFKTWCAADSTALVGVEDAKDLSRLGEFIFRRGVDKPIRCHMKAGEEASPGNANMTDKLFEDAKRIYGKLDFSMCKITENAAVASEGRDRSREASEDFKKALELLRDSGSVSVAHLQRMLGFGFNRAVAVLDDLYNAGYVGSLDEAGVRPVFHEKFQENGGDSKDEMAQ